MKIFDGYARYYDLLYKDKNYQEETAFVDSLLRKHDTQVHTLLDVGCGTGSHAFCMADMGYVIKGIDASQVMLDIAKYALSNPSQQSRSDCVTFHHSSIQELNLSEKFDAAVSLFHVMSYQTDNDALKSAFVNVREHLKPNGVFVFDFWYGPAVLTEKPTPRVKNLQNESVQIIRIANPLLHPNENIVDVDYTVFVIDHRGNLIEKIQETHKMRYLFIPELMFLLEECGFHPCEFGEWITGKALGMHTWNAYCVAKKTI